MNNQSANVSLLLKVVVWRVISMACSFISSFIITGETVKSVGITLTTGILLMCVQWVYEILWEKYITKREKDV